MEALRRQSLESIISAKTTDSVFFVDTSTPSKPLLEQITNEFVTPEKTFEPVYTQNRVDFGSVADTIDVNDSVSIQKGKLRKSADSKSTSTSTSTSVDVGEDFDMWYVTRAHLTVHYITIAELLLFHVSSWRLCYVIIHITKTVFNF